MSEKVPGARKRNAAWVGIGGTLITVLTVMVIVYVPRILSGGKAESDISKLKLTAADGSSLDYDRVLLGERVTFTATAEPAFRGDEPASFTLLIRRGAAEVIERKTFEIPSSGEPQTKKLTLTLPEGLPEGSGANFTAEAILESPDRNDALKLESHLPFYGAPKGTEGEYEAGYSAGYAAGLSSYRGDTDGSDFYEENAGKPPEYNRGFEDGFNDGIETGGKEEMEDSN